MQYKYGTIYREIINLPYKIDFCYAVKHLEESMNNPFVKEFKKMADDSVPGFIRPCPWKVRLKSFGNQKHF